MKLPIVLAVSALVVFLLTPSLFGQSSPTVIILSGIPIKKDMSDIGGTQQVDISKSDQWHYRVEITRKDGRYYWASRENKELIYRKSGEFHNFIEPTAAGYIRVVKTEQDVLYMENLTLGLKNITYWGIITEHQLP